MEFKITLFQSKELGINNGILVESEFGDTKVVEAKYDWNLWPKLNVEIKHICEDIKDRQIYQNLDIEK